MKIIRQKTSNKLILRHRPIALWLIGSFLIIMGVIIIILFSKASSFTCERVLPNDGFCELTYSHFIMSKSLSFKINELQGTEVVMTATRGIDSFFILKPHYSLVLLISVQKPLINNQLSIWKFFFDGHLKRIPFTPYSGGSTNRAEQEIIAAQINSFLHKRDETSLVIKRDNRWLVYFFGGVLIVLGLLAKLSRKFTVIFDKTSGVSRTPILKIKRQTLLGNKVIEYSLDDIAQVKVKATSPINSQNTLYQVVVVLKSGETLPLTSNSSLAKAKKQRIVDEITNFLNNTITTRI